MTTTSSPRPEHVARSHVRDVTMPDGAGTMALLTLDNGLDRTRPTTLGPEGLAGLRTTLEQLRARAAAGDIHAIAVTGKPGVLAAGADLMQATAVATRDEARELARSGHAAYSLLHDAGVPTFAFVNGIALGGGLELALACDYRTVSTSAAALALPETSLGLVPGWGGTYLLPRLVGIERACEAILTRPAQNKPYTPQEAVDIGLADVLLDSTDFLDLSIAWAAGVVRGQTHVARPAPADADEWAAVLARARAQVDITVAGARPAPYRALDLLALGPDATREEGFAAEEEALADLLMTDELRASIYAFTAVSAAKKPKDAPPEGLARPVTRVGILGAGLMAAQLALVLAQHLDVPVVMRDLDDERVSAGLAHVRDAVAKLVARGRVPSETGAHIVASVHGTTALEDLAGCDLVIEAVTEELALKKRVLAEIETVVGPGCTLATNTSALSVTEMAADLAHPERVVGLHFFNPVAQMPLVEVVRAEATDEATLATAFDVVRRLRKTAVGVADRPGFVVNRLLVLLLGEVVRAVEEGTPVEVADRALRPLNLPMGPFALFDLVGPAVGLHVLTTLRENLGDRFARSPGLERIVAEGRQVVLPPIAKGLPARVDPAVQEVFGEPGGPGALDEAGVLDRVLAALATEIGLMLEEGVADVTQIDVCMILGAGWHFATGGIAPYLDRTGTSQRVLGRRLLPDGRANVPGRP